MARKPEPDTPERLLAEAVHLLRALDPVDAHASWLPDYIERTWGPRREAFLERLDAGNA